MEECETPVIANAGSTKRVLLRIGGMQFSTWVDELSVVVTVAAR